MRSYGSFWHIPLADGVTETWGWCRIHPQPTLLLMPRPQAYFGKPRRPVGELGCLARVEPAEGGRLAAAAALGPPSPRNQFWAKLRGSCGALRDGRESARRNAEDALFPPWRTNVPGPGRGGPDITAWWLRDHVRPSLWDRSPPQGPASPGRPCPWEARPCPGAVRLDANPCMEPGMNRGQKQTAQEVEPKDQEEGLEPEVPPV